MLQFAIDHPAQYTHVLKTDDDTWVQPSVVVRLIHEQRLRAHHTMSLYLGCFVEFQRDLLTDPTSKWHVPEEVMAASALPQHAHYAHGFGYVLSTNLIEHALTAFTKYTKNISSVPAWFHGIETYAIEDLMIGLLLNNAVEETSNCENFSDNSWPGSSPRYSEIAVRHLRSDSPQILPLLARGEKKHI
jgi:hypothetical protein